MKFLREEKMLEIALREIVWGNLYYQDYREPSCGHLVFHSDIIDKVVLSAK